jgi:hypothetical protein
MRDWVASHPPGRSLWVELEPLGGGLDGAAQSAIVAHVRSPWGEVRDLELARCGLHPLRLDVRRPAVEELRALLVDEAVASVRF